MKNLLIKLGLWEEKISPTIDTSKTIPFDISYQNLPTKFINEALRHHCYPCKRWFSDVRGAGAHKRIVHEGIFKKDRSKDA